VARSRWLHHMRRRVAYRAIRVGQPIGMKVHLLDRGAEEQKDGAQDRKHETFTRFRCPVLAHSSHTYRLLYSTWMANGTWACVPPWVPALSRHILAASNTACGISG
jgi:hypothetical protein